MPIKRTPHWATRELHDFLVKTAAKPFDWPTHNCCFFPADAIREMTGVDIAADFRGKFHDQASAYAAIRSITGGKTVGDAAAWCAQKHGLEERPNPRFAQRGDLVTLINEDGAEIAAIVSLTGRHLVTVGHAGLMTFSVEKVKRAWKV